mmetsp:Transcript_66887/g.158627  ORF Transcript_66887/g.158627 Transcript_66887/m.158627 type:complete len:465 (+) Transcript_66887:108-1502(+)
MRLVALQRTWVLLFCLLGVAAVGAAGEGDSGEAGVGSAEGLLKWSKEHGADTEHVGLRKDGDGMVLVAKQDFAAGDVMFSVPAGLLFPTRVSDDSPVVAMIENATIGRISAMCLYLIAERHTKESFWQPWLASLPTGEEFFHALSYQDDDMVHFQASSFRELRSRKVANLEKEYTEKVLPLVEKLPTRAEAQAAGIHNLTREDVSKEAFAWAYSVVTTRAIFPGLLSDNERREEVPLVILGPMTDAFSHGRAATAISYDAVRQRCIFSALEPLTKGDSLSVGIGVTSNMELLANRGQLFEQNENNFVLIKFQLDAAGDMHASARQAMMTNLNLTNPMTYVVRKGEMPQGLLSSLRIQSLTPVEFAAYHKALTSPITLENEWRAYRLLIASCNGILGLYPTSTEEDQALLQGGATLNRRTRAALLLRRQEKEIYESIKAWAAEAWGSLLYASSAPPNQPPPPSAQ